MRKIAVGLLLVVALTACSNDTQPTLPADDSAVASPRVITLSPHLAEMMYDVGAGDLLVGVSAYSDYPAQVLDVPIIGDAFAIDLEQLAVLRPDMLLAWDSGTPTHVIEQLREAGYRVEVIHTEGLDDVAPALLMIGELTGQSVAAQQVASQFAADIEVLAEAHAGAVPIRVFYQIYVKPLYTINDQHYISDLIDLCGGQNIFADIGELAPTVDVESVVDRDPEVMLAGDDSNDDRFTEWQGWPTISASRYGNFFLTPSNQIGRATTRLAEAAISVCESLATARANRDAFTG